MRKLLSTLAVAALLAGYAGAAQAGEHWYGRADIGLSVDGEATVPEDEYSPCDYYEEYYCDYQSEWTEWNSPSANTVELEDDWMFDVAVGRAFDNGFRADGELASRTNRARISNSSSEAQVRATSAMINGFYDIMRDGPVQPYVGIGAGFVRVDANGEDDTSLAWQAMAGLAIPVRERMHIDIGYRHFEADELEYSALPGSYEHDAVTLGLRYEFAGPAPAPVAPAPAPAPEPTPIPPPAACPTSQFVVYFEWDRSNLNAAAAATLDQAVARARQCNVSAVAVIGHTDTSGSNRYNMGLSQRRAAVVRDGLVSRGMAASLMTLQARGESELAQPTRDGVREPLNRRTAVTISFR